MAGGVIGVSSSFNSRLYGLRQSGTSSFRQVLRPWPQNLAEKVGSSLLPQAKSACVDRS
jgi:hypothetical protein